MERRFAARREETLKSAVVDPRAFRDVQPQLENFWKKQHNRMPPLRVRQRNKGNSRTREPLSGGRLDACRRPRFGRQFTLSPGAGRTPALFPFFLRRTRP
jgi:hypothetical protein